MSRTGSAAVVCAFLAAAEPALADGDVERGRAVAEQQCSRCHVIGDFNRMGGIGSTPSFQLLVNALEDYEDRFRSFFARRPHPAFVTVKGYPRPNALPANAAPIEITDEKVEDVLAFAKTLRKQ